MKYVYYFVFSIFTICSAIATDHHDLPIFSNDHLKMAYKTCQAYVDFEQSNLEEYENTSIIAPEAIPHLKQNIEAGEKVKDVLLKCEQGLLQPHKVLEVLLTGRLQFLNSRADIIRTVRTLITQGATSEGKRPIYRPTNPDFFDRLPDNGKTLARMSTDRYQLFNQIILYVWKCVNPRELPSHVKTFVRCSPMLWPNLIGEREYLGHPDEAILEYAGENFPYEKDQFLYRHHIEEFDGDIQLRNWTNTTCKIKTTLYFRSLWDKNFAGYEKIQDLPYPQWLMPIRPQPATPQILTIPQITEETPQVSITTLSTLALHDALEPQQISSSPPATASTPPAIQPSPKISNVPAPKFIQQQTKAISTSTVSSTPPALPKTNYDLLKGKKKKMIDSIFDPSSYNSITFGQFKNLWVKLHKNGSVKENTGSSHKKLVSNDGQVFPIFVHGDGMRYTRNTIKYLRDALRDSGYSPFDD